MLGHSGQLSGNKVWKCQDIYDKNVHGKVVDKWENSLSVVFNYSWKLYIAVLQTR